MFALEYTFFVNFPYSANYYIKKNNLILSLFYSIILHLILSKEKRRRGEYGRIEGWGWGTLGGGEVEVPAPTGLGYGQPEDPLGRATADGGRVRRSGGMRGTDSNFKCNNRFRLGLVKKNVFFIHSEITWLLLNYHGKNLCGLKSNS